MEFIVIFMFICLLGMGCCDGDIDTVVSFVKVDDRPTILLIPFICWSGYKLNILTKNLCEAGVPIGFAFQPNRTEYFLHHVVVLADLSCPGTDRFLIQANERENFKSPYRWLLISSEVEQWAVLEDLHMLIDSDVVIAKKLNDQQFLFIEVYKIIETSELIFTPRASWKSFDILKPDNSSDNDSNSLTLYDDSKRENLSWKKNSWIEDYRKSKILSSRRNNVRRHPLAIISVITDSNDTRKHMSDRLNLHQDSIAKMTYSIVSICFEMLNATEKIIFTHTWGYKDKEGKWQGIVDHLMKKEGDLGTLTIFTQERIEVIDYIAMVGSTAVRFVFREPPLAYLANIFALPFTGMVWLAIFVCVLGCALFLYITSKWEASMSMHPLQLDGSWADVLILIIGAVLQQGCTVEPRYAAGHVVMLILFIAMTIIYDAYSANITETAQLLNLEPFISSCFSLGFSRLGRVVMLILFIAMTILYAAYSANIVVLLRAPSSSVRSLPDLLNSPLKLGASDFEYNRYFFKKLNEPVRKAIYNKKIAPKGKKPNFYTMEQGVEKIRQGLFAFHMELNPGYRLIQETYQEHEKCDLVEIDYINEIDPWVPGQKRAANKELYKINFIKIREMGIQSCMHRRLHVGRPRCSGTMSTFSSVGITDMYPAMLATLYGFLLAPAVLVVEIMYHKLMVARALRRRMIHPDREDSALRFYYN